jgi:hypothetical protein
MYNLELELVQYLQIEAAQILQARSMTVSCMDVAGGEEVRSAALMQMCW